MRHALVDKSLADVVPRFVFGRHLAGKFRFLLEALLRVGQQVVGILGGHQAGTRQRQSDAAGVAGDPAPAPLLGNIGGSATAAGWIEHEVAWVGGHEEATLNHLYGCLHDIELRVYIPRAICVIPYICDGLHSKIVKESHKSDTVFRSLDAVGPHQSLHPIWICFLFCESPKKTRDVTNQTYHKSARPR